jgi:hypothetical protein
MASDPDICDIAELTSESPSVALAGLIAGQAMSWLGNSLLFVGALVLLAGRASADARDTGAGILLVGLALWFSAELIDRRAEKRIAQDSTVGSTRAVLQGTVSPGFQVAALGPRGAKILRTISVLGFCGLTVVNVVGAKQSGVSTAGVALGLGLGLYFSVVIIVSVFHLGRRRAREVFGARWVSGLLDLGIEDAPPNLNGFVQQNRTRRVATAGGRVVLTARDLCFVPFRTSAAEALRIPFGAIERIDIQGSGKRTLAQLHLAGGGVVNIHGPSVQQLSQQLSLVVDLRLSPSASSAGI